jgi:CO dehydrogenase/acetyl-CoA synthase alpha subunit
MEPIFIGDVLLTKSCKHRQNNCSTKNKQIFLEDVMDAKWNDIVDNTMVRIGMVVVGFGAWLAIGYGLLAA